MLLVDFSYKTARWIISLLWSYLTLQLNVQLNMLNLIKRPHALYIKYDIWNMIYDLQITGHLKTIVHWGIRVILSHKGNWKVKTGQGWDGLQTVLHVTSLCYSHPPCYMHMSVLLLKQLPWYMAFFCVKFTFQPPWPISLNTACLIDVSKENTTVKYILR